MTEQVSYTLLLLVLLATAVLAICPRGTKFCWENKLSHANLIVSERLLWTNTVNSFPKCAESCSKDTACNSFTVTDLGSTKGTPSFKCRGHSFTDFEVSGGQEMNDTRFYWGKFILTMYCFDIVKVAKMTGRLRWLAAKMAVFFKEQIFFSLSILN